MLIGICSDTHGDAGATRAALDIFDRYSVERIVHCGDVGGPSVFDEFVGRRVAFVWGNTDVVDSGTRAYLETVHLSAPREIPLRLEWAERRIAVYHGHERGFRDAPHRLEVDYILHGHTHMQRDDRINGTRIINPGALHRARPKTVATLNLQNDELTFHEVQV